MEKNILLESLQGKTPYTLNLTMLESVGSSNEALKEQVFKEDSPADLNILIAKAQTQGRGQWGRVWVSPYQDNLYFSCRKHFSKSVDALSPLSLLVSLSVIKAITPFIKDTFLKVKWPNDIFYQGAKLSGNLIEIIPTQALSTVIIGIGINVNMQKDPNKAITQSWTSLKKITGITVDMNEVIRNVIIELAKALKAFENKGFEPFLEQWKQHDALLDKTITLKSTYTHQIIATGKVKGINERGELLIEDQEGIKAFSSGETCMVKEGSDEPSYSV